MAPLTAVVLVLAVYRITRLITRDAFPPAAAFRSWVVDRTGNGSSWSYLVECPWCVSPYVAAIVVVAAVAAGASVPLPVLVVPALSAAVGLAGNLWDVPE